ncbi:DeoR/GlpR family DNA-binding transcription regulator [Cellulomonas carbonis]|uniref:Cro/Cl family transcriptional regulator n=1 Tax=Cellulomonas carbonis T26 TaxID=947969 RepID=A0A0A0BVT3_9CELL|nr:DeoR/GlpR family DNA-binding transcription regulator [Cellulomonas carbonis]KGM11767.1 Cro/Cl family transcriptional regulator [Cellulomonas carbonis T26]MDT0165371.1 DeoR/GlpR family DNA-binding transcription regulator [Actinotalea sp. AC32]GGC08979.1 GntR family transcriptional regulator [Cellulomonas carbonis]
MLKDETEPLPVTTRRERMLQVIAERQFVRVADLAGAFGISDVTVRADLAALESTHAVRRVRGGAMAPAAGSNRAEPSFEEALVEFAGEKQRIGEYVAGVVASGSSILLDVGTTTTAVARALVARADLEHVTVITNGLNIALELEPALGRFTVVVTGGTLRRLQHSLVDPLATVLLGRLHADLAVIGCNGVDAEHGVTNLNLPEAEIKQRMIAAADRTVVVADGSKLGQVHLGRIGSVRDVDTVVTGASAPAHELARLRRADVDVVRVE